MKSPRYDEFLKAARKSLAPAFEDAQVPYAFEKRVMTRIRGLNAAPADVWKLLVPSMWRAAFACLAVTIVTGAVVRYGSFSRPAELFAGDLERTVLAPVDVEDSW
ncbi:MAG TPA: hypothetical protein VGR78_11395 [Verrucomicrobiae bacterium]|jgi:hypothetical protein|nr:hypothetical protein [Verrucomicrobiae bacterium]